MTSQTDPFAALERNYSAEDHFDRDPRGLGSIQPARPFAGRSCEECGTPSGRPCPSYCSTVTPED